MLHLMASGRYMFLSMNGNLVIKLIGYFRNTALKIYIFVTAFLFLPFFINMYLFIVELVIIVYLIQQFMHFSILKI